MNWIQPSDELLNNINFDFWEISDTSELDVIESWKQGEIVQRSSCSHLINFWIIFQSKCHVHVFSIQHGRDIRLISLLIHEIFPSIWLVEIFLSYEADHLMWRNVISNSLKLLLFIDKKIINFHWFRCVEIIQSECRKNFQAERQRSLVENMSVIIYQIPTHKSVPHQWSISVFQSLWFVPWMSYAQLN